MDGVKPRLGDIARARDVGFPRSGAHKMRWSGCVDCGAQRWVFLRAGKLQSERCHPCGAVRRGKTFVYPTGPDNAHWVGPRIVGKNGYARLWVNPNDPLASMRGKDGRVYEHRIVMARHLGRPLLGSEDVHHLNGDKLDNEIGNLEILDKRDHARRHLDSVVALRRRIAELEGQLA